MTCSILLVEDDRAFQETLALDLGQRGWEVRAVSSVAEALDQLAIHGDMGIVVADIHVKGSETGLELCSRIAASYPDLPVIVITGFGSMEVAIEAIRAGAYDFVAKPFDTDALVLALERASDHRRMKQELIRLRRASGPAQVDAELIGASRAMQRVRELIERLADSETTVLLTGESGTGKEVAARELHRRSRRASQPLVSVNCAAMPDALLESELFGHARGAFTDAHKDRAGLFQRAHGGTLLLDEIGELPLALQAKLLRVLQDHVVRPVGGDEEITVDVRVIAATNRDLEAAVEQKKFRADLYFRVNVIQLPLPPLRARESDVLVLAQHFLERFAERAGKRVVGLSLPAARKLSTYVFPGNVRELSNAMERAVALTRYAEITIEDLPDRIRQHRPTHVVVATDDPSELQSMDEIERRYVTRVLQAVNGHRTEAARILGWDRKTLYRKLIRYKLVEDDGAGTTDE